MEQSIPEVRTLVQDRGGGWFDYDVTIDSRLCRDSLIS